MKPHLHIGATEFKDHKRSAVISTRGKPFVKLAPVDDPKGLLGCMKGTTNRDPVRPTPSPSFVPPIGLRDRPAGQPQKAGPAVPARGSSRIVTEVLFPFPDLLW